jgi:PHD-like zinc-binding domain
VWFWCFGSCVVLVFCFGWFQTDHDTGNHISKSIKMNSCTDFVLKAVLPLGAQVEPDFDHRYLVSLTFDQLYARACESSPEFLPHVPHTENGAQEKAEPATPARLQQPQDIVESYNMAWDTFNSRFFTNRLEIESSNDDNQREECESNTIANNLTDIHQPAQSNATSSTRQQSDSERRIAVSKKELDAYATTRSASKRSKSKRSQRPSRSLSRKKDMTELSSVPSRSSSSTISTTVTAAAGAGAAEHETTTHEIGIDVANSNAADINPATATGNSVHDVNVDYYDGDYGDGDYGDGDYGDGDYGDGDYGDGDEYGADDDGDSDSDGDDGDGDGDYFDDGKDNDDDDFIDDEDYIGGAMDMYDRHEIRTQQKSAIKAAKLQFGKNARVSRACSFCAQKLEWSTRDTSKRCVGARIIKFDGRLTGPYQSGSQYLLMLHMSCVKWALRSEQMRLNRSRNIRVVDLLRRAGKSDCTRCQEPGALIRCQHERCKAVLHLPCLIGSKCELTDDFLMYCPKHASDQQSDFIPTSQGKSKTRSKSKSKNKSKSKSKSKNKTKSKSKSRTQTKSQSKSQEKRRSKDNSLGRGNAQTQRKPSKSKTPTKRRTSSKSSNKKTKSRTKAARLPKSASNARTPRGRSDHVDFDNMNLTDIADTAHLPQHSAQELAQNASSKPINAPFVWFSKRRHVRRRQRDNDNLPSKLRPFVGSVYDNPDIYAIFANPNRPRVNVERVRQLQSLSLNGAAPAAYESTPFAKLRVSHATAFLDRNVRLSKPFYRTRRLSLPDFCRRLSASKSGDSNDTELPSRLATTADTHHPAVASNSQLPPPPTSWRLGTSAVNSTLDVEETKVTPTVESGWFANRRPLAVPPSVLHERSVPPVLSHSSSAASMSVKRNAFESPSARTTDIKSPVTKKVRYSNGTSVQAVDRMLDVTTADAGTDADSDVVAGTASASPSASATLATSSTESMLIAPQARRRPPSVNPLRRRARW